MGANIQHIRFYGLQSPNSTGYQGFKGTYTSDPGDRSGAVTGAGLADFALDQENYASLNSTTTVTISAGITRPMSRTTGKSGRT